MNALFLGSAEGLILAHQMPGSGTRLLDVFLSLPPDIGDNLGSLPFSHGGTALGIRNLTPSIGQGSSRLPLD